MMNHTFPITPIPMKPIDKALCSIFSSLCSHNSLTIFQNSLFNITRSLSPTKTSHYITFILKIDLLFYDTNLLSSSIFSNIISPITGITIILSLIPNKIKEIVLLISPDIRLLRLSNAELNNRLHHKLYK